ncbi:MAG: amino acid adenylation domain-containing protein [Paracoccaceae bacterium]
MTAHPKPQAAPAYPLTEAQSGLWLFQRLDPANPILNTGQYLEITGALDIAAFQDAVRAMIDEAEALSLRITDGPDGPVQWHDLAATPTPGFADLRDRPDPAAEARALMAADTARPLDPANDPLAAFTLYQLGEAHFFWYQRVHHLAIDGYAMVLITNRVAEIYRAQVMGAAPGTPLAPLARAYDEDAAYRGSDQRAKDAAFWRAAMADLPEEVTHASTAPLAPAHHFLRESQSLGAGDMAAIHRLAERAGVPWPDALTALVAVYCQRMSGADEAVVGVPHMGRLGSPTARVPCMKMNVLPLRIAPDEDAPLGDALRDVAARLAKSRRHGRYRSEQLRRDLGLVGGTRRLMGPLINVQPFDLPPRLPGLDVRLHIMGAGAVEDLTFTFRGDARTALIFEVDANPHLHSPAETRAHAARLLSFLARAAEAPGLADLGSASPAELTQLLAVPHHPVADVTLSAMIERQMRETPEATALVFEGSAMRYGDLNAASAALAARLRAMGAGPERIVAVALERSLALPVALVAILRAGAAYLPLDPAHPRERQQNILAQAQPVAVLTQADLAEPLAGPAPLLFAPDWTGAQTAGFATDETPHTAARPDLSLSPVTDPALIARERTQGDIPQPAADGFTAQPDTSFPARITDPVAPARASATGADKTPDQPGAAALPHSGAGTIAPASDTANHTAGAPPDASPDTLAYVIFTSGSTGAPKGAMITHRAIVNRLEWMRAQYGIRADDRILQKTPATFDVSVWEFFLPLITGATLVLAAPGAHRDPAALAALIRRERITTAHFVPSMLSAFLAAPVSEGLRLRRVFCSGEELTPDQRARFHRRIRAELHNLYGPTEAAVDVSHWPATPQDASSPVPIGFAVWNTRLIVLDARMRPVPPGIAGELYLGGVQLGRGYLGRPDLTEERFLPDPFSPGERLYRTGDIAVRRADGAFTYLGRSDGQVKIRGLRIEPGEIETALMATTMATEAAVIAREDRPGDKRLVAYLVPAPGYDEAGLRHALRAALPDYMIPAAFVTLAALPVTANGKLDRRALPTPAAPDVAGTPRTETETRLAALYREVLGLSALPGPEADFFALGGDSLLALRLLLRIEESFGRDPGLGAVFERPDIAGLAAALDMDAADDGLGPVIRLADGPGAPVFLIHPAGGLAWGYRALAHALGPRPVWGLQSPGLDRAQPLPESLDALAEDYAARILAISPAGPWHLAGWSLGGILAQAIAARLEAMGHKPGLVALLDAYPADCWRARPDPDPVTALRALLAIAGHDAEAHPELTTLQAVTDFLRASDSPLGRLPEAARAGVIRTVTDTNRLVRGHHHRRYGGRLTHIRAGLDHADSGLTPDLWAPYAAELDLISVPFMHPQMTSPEASALIAPELFRRLEDAQ